MINRELLQLEYFNVPLYMVYKILFEVPKNREKEVKFEIFTKDLRVINLLIRDHSIAMQLFDNLKRLWFPGKFKDHSYCIVNSKLSNLRRQLSTPVWLDSSPTKNNKEIPDSKPAQNGWQVYDFKQEFKRQGLNRVKELFMTIRWWGGK